jgi:hypothetical protein
MYDSFTYTTPFQYEVDHVDSEDCWCEPEIVEIGDMVVILQHRRCVC